MSNVPKLRFKEFSGEWEEKSLKDLTKINQGLQIPIADRFTEQVENSYFYITNEFLKETSSNKYFIKNPPESVLCTESDVLMTRTGNTGQVVTNVNGAFHNNFFKIKYSDDLNKNFLVEFLRLVDTQNMIMRYAGTSTIPDLNHGDFYKLKLNLPSKQEQEKIASFLTSVDSKIEQLTKKEELLSSYKKGVMQKIFSGEIRFKADDGSEFCEWEEKNVGQCINHIGGTALEKYVSNEAKYNFISIGNYSTTGKYIDNGQRVELNEKTRVKLLEKDDLVMVLNDKTSSGDIIGSTIHIDENDKYIYNQRSERIICKDNILPLYFWHYFNSQMFRRKVFSLAQGGTQIYINFSSVKSIETIIPCLEEQTKIANFLSSIDDKIEQVQKQLNSTKEFKKALLQQMFV